MATIILSAYRVAVQYRNLQDPTVLLVLASDEKDAAQRVEGLPDHPTAVSVFPMPERILIEGSATVLQGLCR
jgi:hypothetical protein